MPDGNRITPDSRQHIVFVDYVVLYEIADSIIVATDAMEGALGFLTSTTSAKIFPIRLAKLMEKEKLVMLKFGTLPDLE